MVPDGGHDVAEVQGSDGAAFLLVFLCKRLASVLQLQLLEQQTDEKGKGQKSNMHQIKTNIRQNKANHRSLCRDL